MVSCWSRLDYVHITAHKVAEMVFLIISLPRTYNRSSPSSTFSLETVLDLRTIIVIADIDRGLHSPAKQITPLHLPCLTFRHWSGVTPYTSSYEFAGSCVFGKQLPGNLSLRPLVLLQGGRPYPEVTAAFLPSSLRTSHSFALVFST